MIGVPNSCELISKESCSALVSRMYRQAWGIHKATLFVSVCTNQWETLVGIPVAWVNYPWIDKPREQNQLLRWISLIRQSQKESTTFLLPKPDICNRHCAMSESWWTMRFVLNSCLRIIQSPLHAWTKSCWNIRLCSGLKLTTFELSTEIILAILLV
jgi:hypothetical protein